ncbi:hypothetical protein ACFYNO_18400 [Kitasatospora sp. NPDC006697]|uniref:hypothetical protein n=1 Tax=Kitasatospora sp. NPDC006697 TaxID=3364020 RepID=UPI003681B191
MSHRWVVVAAFALAALAGDRAAGGPDLPRAAVTTVLLSADGRELSVARSGECLGTGELRARETPSAVLLDFRNDPPTPDCYGGAELTVWSARLAAPLGTRALRDAGGGAPVPYFRAADLPAVGPLPPGYRHAYDAPGYLGTASAGQWGPAASELFLAGTARLWLVVEYGRHWPDGWPGGGVAPLVVVQGRLARVGPGGIAWQQRDAEGAVRSYALVADPPLPTAQLVGMADRLRVVMR